MDRTRTATPPRDRLDRPTIAGAPARTVCLSETLGSLQCRAGLRIAEDGSYVLDYVVRALQMPRDAERIQVGFVLFDAAGRRLDDEVRGMDAAQSCRVAPAPVDLFGAAARRVLPVCQESVAGRIPPNLLEQAARIAICFRRRGEKPKWRHLAAIAAAPGEDDYDYAAGEWLALAA